MFLYAVYVHSMIAIMIGHQLFSAFASKFAVLILAINGFNAQAEQSFKTEKFGFTSTSSVSVAVFNRNRTEIFGYRTGLTIIIIIIIIKSFIIIKLHSKWRILYK